MQDQPTSECNSDENPKKTHEKLDTKHICENSLGSERKKTYKMHPNGILTSCIDNILHVI